jgi:hypothetical protein
MSGRGYQEYLALIIGANLGNLVVAVVDDRWSRKSATPRRLKQRYNLGFYPALTFAPARVV